MPVSSEPPAAAATAAQTLQIDTIAEKAPRLPAPSFLYKAGLAAVAVVMILLPLLYIALIAGVAWATFWHAVNDLYLFNTMHTKTATLAYVGPLLGGCVLIFFMLKPLLAKRGTPPLRVALTPQEHPLLWDFVRNICHAMKAPVPSCIEADTSVNASAGFRRGWRSLFSGDLRLCIGLPLVYGLEARQFGGILAHEFGHFSQGAGMRFGYAIHSINSWFAYVVYGRDAWDERLDNWAQHNGWNYAGILLQIARLFVWLSRRILWVLMIIGQAVSSFSSRQMEYDADLREIFLAGSDTFEKTSSRLQELSVSEDMALQIASGSLKENKLPANLPQLTVQRAQMLDEATRQKISQMDAQRKGSLFSTHPTTAQRVKAARKVAATGYYHSTASAALLFDNLDAISEEASKVFYANNGLPLRNISYVSNDSLLGAEKQHDADVSTFDSVFGQYSLNFLRPLSNIRIGVQDDADTTAGAAPALSYTDAVARYHQQAEAAKADVEAFSEALDRKELAVKAGALLRAGFRIKPQDFGLSKSDIDTAKEQAAAEDRTLARLRTKLKPRDAAAGEIINAALRMPATDEKMERSRTAAAQIVQQTALLNAELLSFLDNFVKATILLDNAQKENSRRFMEAIQVYVERASESRQKILTALSKISYPFSEADSTLNIRKVLTPSVDPNAEWLNRELHCADYFWHGYARFYPRCIGRILDATDRGETTTSAGNG